MSTVTQQQLDHMQAQMQATSAHHESMLAGANAQIVHLSQQLDAMQIPRPFSMISRRALAAARVAPAKSHS